MLPRFENGIKLLFLLLLTNVSSRSYSDRQDQDDRDQSERYQAEEVPNQWNRDQTERLQSDRDDDQIQNRDSAQDRDIVVYKPKSHRSSLEHSSFLTRLLDTRQGPVVVFLTPGTDVDLDVHKASIKSSDKEAELDGGAVVGLYVPDPAENDAYELYNLLRTTQEDEDLDPEAYHEFEKTKDMLRAAFALRCGARSSCEQKCPKKENKCKKSCEKETKKVKKDCERKCPEKRNVQACENKCEKLVEEKEDECEQKVDKCEEKQEKQCEANCKQIYDEQDACPKPKKESKKKCGKTMPPKWLLRYRS